MTMTKLLSPVLMTVVFGIWLPVIVIVTVTQAQAQNMPNEFWANILGEFCAKLDDLRDVLYKSNV